MNMNVDVMQADWLIYGVGLAILVIVAQAVVLMRRTRATAAVAARSAVGSQTAAAPANSFIRLFFRRYGARIFGLSVVTALYLGWLNRDFSYLKAESGLGYALGIVGGVMMLLLLLYPARKKWRSLKWLGQIKHWFRIHMLFGILGPVAIVFHANFQLGSLNSNVALYCMLLVAGSGLVGRYFYRKVHNGLYGKKTSLEELKAQSVANKGQLAHELRFSAQMKRRLQVFENAALRKDRNLFRSFLHMLFFRVQLLWGHFVLYGQVKEEVRMEGERKVDTVLVHHWSHADFRRHVKDARRYLKTYMATLRRISELHFFERMLSWWHVLHFPLFLAMIVSAIVHTIAVHMY